MSGRREEQARITRMGGTWGISEVGGNQEIKVTRKVEQDLLKRSLVDILDVEREYGRK